MPTPSGDERERVPADTIATPDADGPSRLERLRGSAVGPVVGRIAGVVEGAGRSWAERPGARVRRIRRMGRAPLPSLPDRHPESRLARPVQVGLRSIPVTAIGGTAVGGGDQRGGDYLPLRPFRGANWKARWQRLRAANDRLESLPPIDVVRFADQYWVVDGHNRVALALYANQSEIDATVVELVPVGGRRTEPIGSMSAATAGSLSVRAAAAGLPTSGALGHEDAPFAEREVHGGAEPSDPDEGG